MLVFLSWSGKQSRQVAAALHGWLPKVLQAVDPWMSEKDIALGTRWSPEIADRLHEVKYGVICVTAENMGSPWLNFEAGACSKIVDEAKVIPYVLGLPLASVKAPLSQFQGTLATEDGTRELVKGLNQELSRPLKEDQLKELFDLLWPSLQEKLTEAGTPKTAPEQTRREPQDLLEEILQVVRMLERSNRDSVAGRNAYRHLSPAEITELFYDYLTGSDLDELKREFAATCKPGELVQGWEGDPTFVAKAVARAAARRLVKLEKAGPRQEE